MICGKINGLSGLLTGLVGVAIFFALSFILLRFPRAVVAFTRRHDDWLGSKVKFLRLVLWPRHWLESRLEHLGVAPLVVRGWGVVTGLVGLILLSLLAISVVRPCE